MPPLNATLWWCKYAMTPPHIDCYFIILSCVMVDYLSKLWLHWCKLLTMPPPPHWLFYIYSWLQMLPPTGWFLKKLYQHLLDVHLKMPGEVAVTVLIPSRPIDFLNFWMQPTGWLFSRKVGSSTNIFWQDTSNMAPPCQTTSGTSFLPLEGNGAAMHNTQQQLPHLMAMHPATMSPLPHMQHNILIVFSGCHKTQLTVKLLWCSIF